jgi:hypothetical protein
VETSVQSAPVAASAHLWPPRTRMDRAAYAAIIGTGAICFVLLAWVHLGLGALLFPPVATARAQTATAGSYSLTLRLSSGQLSAAGPNAVILTIRDATGHALDAGSIEVRPVMTTMAMEVPSVSAASQGGGTFVAHPKFAMAGTWRLEVTVAPPGGAAHTASFNVGVRWN